MSLHLRHWPLRILLTSVMVLWQTMTSPVAHAAEQVSYLDAALQWIEQNVQQIDAQPKTATYFDDDRLHWLSIVFSTGFSLIDTSNSLTRTQRDLLTATPCLHAAASLLEAKAEGVRHKLQQAERMQDVWKILQFKELLRHIDAMERALLRGGANPLAIDQGWPAQRSDGAGYCCAPGATSCTQSTEQSCTSQGGRYSTNAFQCQANGCSLPSDAVRMCPFDTDYLPPSVEGYGCDVDAMDRFITQYLQDQPDMASILEQERAALVQVQQTAADQYAQAKAFAIAQAGIDALIRGDEPVLPESERLERTHLRTYGCESQACLNGDPRACRTLTGAVLTEKRGPFTLETDQLRLLQQFQDSRAELDQDRPPPPSVASENTDTALEGFFKRYGQQLFRNVSTDQSRTLSRLFALGVDPQLSVNESLLPFRQAVQRLARLIDDPTAEGNLGGLRRFTRDFAFFLRRTCLDRPCNERLERVLRITFSDQCFPYTSGRFRTANEREECRTAAELNVAPYQ